jgi:hypothetical protein
MLLLRGRNGRREHRGRRGMTTVQDIERVFAEVGPLDERIATVIKTSDGAYAIRFEDVDVLAEWDDTRKRLVLSCEIGAVPPERAGQIYEILLTYSMAWRDTGGLRMALAGLGGNAVQLVDLAGEEIAARRIAIVAVNLAERTRVWRAFFTLHAGEGPGPEPADLLASHMIRV